MLDRGVRKAVKSCIECKRDMVWRKKWASCWEEVQFCSKRCKTANRRASRRTRPVVQQGGGPETPAQFAVSAEDGVPPDVSKTAARAFRKAERRRAKAEQRARRAGGIPKSRPCDRCETLSDLTIRCTIDASQEWRHVCGKCWKHVSGGVTDGDTNHPWYRYGGLWKSR